MQLSVDIPVKDRRFFFSVSFSLKLYCAMVTNADTGSLKSLHTLFDPYLDHMLAKFEPNRIVQNIHDFFV